MNFKTLLFIGALSALPSINDVHTTELEIAETNPTLAVPTADGFRISIDRIDELKDSETGEIVAARDQFIDFSFDIIGGQLHCNGKTIPEGITNMKLDIGSFSVSEDEAVESKFDKGITDVQFDLKAEMVEVSGITLRRLTLSEQILQVNGKSVELDQFVQQIIDVWPTGEFELHEPMVVPVLSEITKASTVDSSAENNAGTLRTADVKNADPDSSFFEMEDESMIDSILCGVVFGLIGMMFAMVFIGLWRVSSLLYERLYPTPPGYESVDIEKPGHFVVASITSSKV